MIFILKNVLRLVLCLNMCSILKTMPCALEKNEYCFVVGWSIL